MLANVRISFVFRDAFVDPIGRPLGRFACGSLDPWLERGLNTLLEPTVCQGLSYEVVLGSSAGSVAALAAGAAAVVSACVAAAAAAAAAGAGAGTGTGTGTVVVVVVVRSGNKVARVQ